MRRHVYYYTHIEQTFEAANHLLCSDPAVWLPDPGLSHGEHWLVDLHADGPLPSAVATHRAAVQVGDPVATPGALLRAITWRCVTADTTVPVLTADLELTPLSEHVCQLSLMGSYRPPMSVLGDVGDHLVGHRVAEACVRQFVHDVAERLVAATLPM